MHEPGAPLGTEAGASRPYVSRDPFVVLHVLGDHELPRLPGAQLAVDPLHQAPAVRDVGAGLGVRADHVADPAGGVPAEPVAVPELQPHERIVTDVLPHLTATVVRPRVAPRRLATPVVVEIDPAFLGTSGRAPAVELPEVEVVGAEVVVDDVEDDGDATTVGGIDEPAEPVRTPVRLLDREDEGGVVAPRDVAGELVGRHHLDDVDAQVGQVVELADDGLEVAAPAARRVEAEAPHVELVDDHLVPGRRGVADAAPRIAGIDDDPVADRAGQRAGVGVVLPERRRQRGVGDDEFVLIARRGAGHVGGPGAMALARQRRRRRAPAVERPRDAHA